MVGSKIMELSQGQLLSPIFLGKMVVPLIISPILQMVIYCYLLGKNYLFKGGGFRIVFLMFDLTREEMIQFDYTPVN